MAAPSFSARVVVVAAIVAASALTTAPVQAQGGGFGFHFEEHGRRELLPHRLCLLTSSGLRRAIARQGYEDIYLNVANNHRIQARASRGRWVYLLTVNSCTGRILDSQRLRSR